MEQEWQNDAGALTAQAIPQKDVEQACFHALGLVGRNCEYLEQHLARVGADEQTLAPAEHFRLRHDGVALEIFQIAVGNETVEIAQADGVFRKDDDVTRAPVHDLSLIHI